MLMIKFMGAYHEIPVRWVPQNSLDGKQILVRGQIYALRTG